MNTVQSGSFFYALKNTQSFPTKCFPLEAPPRFELGIKVLQTSALPLGYGAVNIETDYISNLSHFLERVKRFELSTFTLAR